MLARASSVLGRRAVCVARAAPSVVPAAVRCFSAVVPKGGAKAGSTDLASVLKKEVDYETEEGGGSTDQLSQIAQTLYTKHQFSVEDQRGSARFMLQRAIGGQQVRVDVDCTPVPAEFEDDYDQEEEQQEEDEEEDDTQEGYRALVSVKDAAKGKVMQVGIFVTDVIRISRVAIYDAGAEPPAAEIFAGSEASPLYSGPQFDELDETLQNAFYDYLAERGVDDDLAASVSDYCSSKEQLEYVGWLKGMQSFVKA